MIKDELATSTPNETSSDAEEDQFITALSDLIIDSLLAQKNSEQILGKSALQSTLLERFYES